jgi:type I restriction enzyme R subunit
VTATGLHLEIRFEVAVEAHLLSHGWIKGSVANYDRARSLDLHELFTFIDATQAKAWKTRVGLEGGNEAQTRTKFLKRLTDEIDRRGTIDVFRRGVIDLGVPFKLAYFKPTHGLTPSISAQYAANRLTITRQLPFGPDDHKTLDVALFINGLPVADAELKNPLSGQDIDNAIEQYRKDRDPKATFFARRSIVHFAVDPLVVALTTGLTGKDTAFVPFNQGDDNGAGNPVDPAGGYRSRYLWEQVWQRDAWLDVFSRFVFRIENENEDGTKSPELVFPRYHQWDVVRRLEADIAAHGPGRDYLIEHSAGSGKSKTIAWTAYRLANLHDAANDRIFDKVVVVSDRVALDLQLSAAIKQFEQTKGLVAAIEKGSKELEARLGAPETRIVVTTIQKFPVVASRLARLPGKYAVIVDEAHSSQTGDTAKSVKYVLGAGSVVAVLDAAEAQEAETGQDPDEIVLDVAARGRQPNLSYLAFTATPKQKTLELFGLKGDDGNYHPFHLYSMKQAIEEQFIIDVLRGYATYATYYKVARKIADDPELDKGKAAAAIARFVSLEPHNLDQKAQVIVEHFRTNTAAKIGGQAKAMVVTASRLHAVRYKQALDRYIAGKGYKGLHTLVAFSGTVSDGVADYTEAGMNGFGEKQLPKHFRSSAYQILVVAEKYQTGYDEPLLHTMYVDKKLERVKAVQTLSRLNRKHALKDDTFILDFRNRTEDIQEGFRPFFTETIAEPTDPNLLYNASAILRDFDVIAEEDVEALAAVLAAPKPPPDAHAALYTHLEPATGRFKALAEGKQREFREALDRYVRMYAFLSQVVPFADAALERLYAYARLLGRRIGPAKGTSLDIGADVELTHLRIELTGTHDLSLSDGAAMLPGFGGEGLGPQDEPPKAKLSEIIDLLNERFGLNLGKPDQLYFDQLKEEMVADPDLAAQAKANTLANFGYGFDRVFTSKVVDRRHANEDLFRKLMDDDDFRRLAMDLLRPAVYDQLKQPNPGPTE